MLENLQILVGFLSFLYKVISLGKTFIKRLFNALSNIKRKILYLTANI